jgi:hypothetical protein
MKLPDKKLKTVIYRYVDGSEYEMIDVPNYLDNLKLNASFLVGRNGPLMKPVNWKKIKK